MRVVLARSAGFCRGVRRAVEKARSLARQKSTSVYTDGPLIHNERVMAELRREGVRETDHPERLRHAALVVRAHGISPERRAWLRQLPVQLVDGTCPDVARIQGVVRKQAAAGRFILILGDPGHAEVVGLLGYAAGRGVVVTGPADVRRLRIAAPVCLCSQSTQAPEDFRRTACAVRARFRDALILGTICDATKDRQAELARIASKVEALVVVGSRQSANTLRLVRLARRLRPTFHIEGPEQIQPGRLRRFQSVGLTAGASTPDCIIRAVRQSLQAIDRKIRV